MKCVAKDLNKLEFVREEELPKTQVFDLQLWILSWKWVEKKFLIKYIYLFFGVIKQMLGFFMLLN